MDSCSWRGVWARIAAHTFDDVDAEQPFSVQLAAEQGWDVRQALRCIEEYRRFALLAAITGHPVAPSDAVDQVWHLHLSHSEDYWETFCKHALRRPWHHRPLRGGRAERLHREEAYARTLASYRHIFGERPPRDIWPSVAERFADAASYTRIDRRRVLVLPRPCVRAPRRVLEAARARLTTSDVAYFAAAASLTLLAGSAVAGRTFLTVYAVYAAIVLLAARPLAGLLAGPRLRDDEPLPELDPYALAALSGGDRRVLEVALAKLVGRGVVTLEHGAVRLRDVRYASEHPVEQALMATLVESDPGLATIGQLREALVEPCQGLTRSLLREGLLAREWLRMLPIVLGLTVPSVGLARVLFGLVHARPIGWIALLALSALAIACLLYGPPQTPRGRAVLHEHAELAARVRHVSGPLSATALASVALGGLDALVGTPLAHLAEDLLEACESDPDEYAGARASFGG